LLNSTREELSQEATWKPISIQQGRYKFAIGKERFLGLYTNVTSFCSTLGSNPEKGDVELVAYLE
jgi:hypothetical protein